MTGASAPTKKQHLAALRGSFDKLVVLDPAARVRRPRYSAEEGKTPDIAIEQARTLLQSIDLGHVVGLRDLAVIAVLIYTAARVGAVATLKMKSLEHDGSQWLLKFAEKGGKARVIPVRHDLERYLLACLDAAGLRDAPRDSPLFRSAIGKTKALTAKAATAGDLGRMVKRRLKDAVLPPRLSPPTTSASPPLPTCSSTASMLTPHGKRGGNQSRMRARASSRTRLTTRRRPRFRLRFLSPKPATAQCSRAPSNCWHARQRTGR